MQCPLCGFIFDETEMSCHASCAFNKGCAIICCPNCGYQVTDESKSRLARLARRVFDRRSNVEVGETPLCQLSALHPGQVGRVVTLQSSTRQEQLNVFGLIPGAQVTLQQKHPAYVIRVGFTELAIDREIADRVVVEVEG
jgi:Fe2+ transport system protein FeoA